MAIKTFSFNTVPPVFKRSHHVLIALFDAENRLYLSRKNIYPTDIFRLFGGGVEGSETKEAAAVREAKEETGLLVNPNHQETFEFNITEESTKQTYHLTIDLFYVNIHWQRITPGDDVKGMKLFTKEDMPELIETMVSLASGPFTDKNNQVFTWKDWGTIFGVIHQYVYNNWPK